MTLGDVISKMAGLKLTTVGTIDGLRRLGEFTWSSAMFTENAAVGFTNFSNATGIAAQELQKWQILGRQVNVTNGTMANSIFKLQQNLLDFRIMGKGAEPWYWIGETPEGIKSVDDMMDKLSHAAQRVPRPIMTKALMAMGLDPSMMNVLLMSSADRKRAQVASGLSDADIAAGMRFNSQFNEFKTQWTQFQYFMGETVFPYLIDFFSKINAIAENKPGAWDAVAEGLIKHGLPGGGFGDRALSIATVGLGAAVHAVAGAENKNVDVKVSINANESSVAKEVAKFVKREVGVAEQISALSDNYVTYPSGPVRQK